MQIIHTVYIYIYTYIYICILYTYNTCVFLSAFESSWTRWKIWISCTPDLDSVFLGWHGMTHVQMHWLLNVLCYLSMYQSTSWQVTHFMTMESHNSELIAPLSTGDFLNRIWIAGYTHFLKPERYIMNWQKKTPVQCVIYKDDAKNDDTELGTATAYFAYGSFRFSHPL